MVMTGLHFTGRVPFARVHLTGLVRDAEGQKMSKTRGNVLDPEELIAEYGADAMRFTLAQLDAPGRDIPLDAERMAGYRAFGNKIWNATRFALGKAGGARVAAAIEPAGLELPERWILARVAETAAAVDAHFERFRFDLACQALYQFFWSDFCDWYIEMAKPGLEGAAARLRTGDVLLTVLERALRLLHPVMPHLTEELWQRLPGHEAIHPETICLAPFPVAEAAWTLSEDDLEHLEVLRDVVGLVRNERTERELPPKTKARLSVEGKDSERATAAAEFLAAMGQRPLLWSLAGVSGVEIGAGRPQAGRHLLRGVHVAVEFEAAAQAGPDPEKVRAELAEVEANLGRVRERLANPGFTGKAPAAVVEGARRQLAELEARRARLVSTPEAGSEP